MRVRHSRRRAVLAALTPLGARDSYQYTGGFLTAHTDPLSRATGFTRDAQGFVTRQDLPDGSALIYQYDANAYHSLTTTVDALDSDRLVMAGRFARSASSDEFLQHTPPEP